MVVQIVPVAVVVVIRIVLRVEPVMHAIVALLYASMKVLVRVSVSTISAVSVTTGAAERDRRCSSPCACADPVVAAAIATIAAAAAISAARIAR